ncbi:MAG: NADH-quinone oxidoreductase subunit [Frankiaceae bacterium]|nr:NADH-quinone oxidoreductase subunit [Frankiaceae bacterium]
MTATDDRTATPATPPPVDTVTLTIDGFQVTVPKGTLVIRAAEQLGIQIPRFCDHPLLDPVGACRQCIVEVEGQRKPLASCTTTVTDGMVVKTQLTSPVAEKAQAGNIEFLLLNHPLDCPMCDKGGECPLQNQALSNGPGESRFRDVKRTYPKPIAISSEVLLDRERCVLCARCTRFSQQIAGDPFIDLFERGGEEQVAISAEEPFESYFSGNTVQICPVGALTSAAYRFRARPFDLVSAPSACEHCASGCAMRTDHRRGKVVRRLAGEDLDVNEEWNCDKGRFAFTYTGLPDRLTTPLIRDIATGDLREATWTEALQAAAEGLAAAKADGGVGVLAGGRLTLEDAFAYSKFARVVLGTNDIDSRAREHSSEEAAFLAAHVAGQGLGVTYTDLETAPAVLLAGLEPEEESPIIFLRLRKGTRNRGLKVWSVAPFTSRGLSKLRGTALHTVPGGEPSALDGLASGDAAAAVALRQPGAVILVGERLAGVPGALSAAARLAAATGARLAWVPRRAGERGAIDAGCLPNLLPGGGHVLDASARGSLGELWGTVPSAIGRSTGEILAAAAAGQLSGLVVGGVEIIDLPDPVRAAEALGSAFVVSLEIRHSDVTALADVVLPVAAVAEKGGTFVDWEGRPRPFAQALTTTQRMTDTRVLNALADALGVRLGLPDVDAARAELSSLPPRTGAPVVVDEIAKPLASLKKSQAFLATWRELLDAGSLQDGEPHLAGTAHIPLARLSAGTAASLGVVEGGALTITGPRGSAVLPVAIADLPPDVVWLPEHPHTGPGARAVGRSGAVVTLRAGGVV